MNPSLWADQPECELPTESGLVRVLNLPARALTSGFTPQVIEAFNRCKFPYRTAVCVSHFPDCAGSDFNAPISVEVCLPEIVAGAD